MPSAHEAGPCVPQDAASWSQGRALNARAGRHQHDPLEKQLSAGLQLTKHAGDGMESTCCGTRIQTRPPHLHWDKQCHSLLHPSTSPNPGSGSGLGSSAGPIPHSQAVVSASPRHHDPAGACGPHCIPCSTTTSPAPDHVLCSCTSQLCLSLLLNFRMHKQPCLLRLVPQLCLSAEPTVYLLISGESLCVNIAVNSLASLPSSAAL